MKPFRPTVFLVLSFLFLLGTGCSGSGDKNASAPPPSVNSANETAAPPPVTSDTQTRLEAYARLINQPKEAVFSAWNAYGAANHLDGLGDLNLNSDEALRIFIGDFILKTDLSLNAVAAKIFGSDQLMIKIQAAYLAYTSGNGGGGTDGEPHLSSAFFSDLQNLKTAVGDFGRMFANDLNTLFPNQFTFTSNFTDCDNSPCNDFVQRSVAFLNNNVRERTLRETDPVANVTTLDSLTAFFKLVFNNLSFSVDDKVYVFHNFKTGETRLTALPQEYVFEGFNPPKPASNTSDLANGVASPSPPANSGIAVGFDARTTPPNSNTVVGPPSSQTTNTEWQWTAPNTNWSWTAPQTNWSWTAPNTDTSTDFHGGGRSTGTTPTDSFHGGGGTSDTSTTGAHSGGSGRGGGN